MAPRPPSDDPLKPPDPSLGVRAFETGELPQILIDAKGVVMFANERARTLFGLSGEEVGRPIEDLELSHRPADLRSLIEQAAHDRRTAVAERVEWIRGHESAVLDVHVVPLLADGGTILGTRITFLDVTGYHDLEERLSRSQREAKTVYEELRSTIEELETTNEGLQSTNEELGTINEELQSTSEELRTINEELQSTKDELETTKAELRRRSVELNEVTIFFESVLLSLGVAVIVTDPALRVLVWNREASALWGLRSDEVEGQHLLNLEIGFPVDRLRDPLRACLGGQSRRERLWADGISRRGRPVMCSVICTPLRRGDEIRGAVIVMEQVEQPSASRS
jgi:two-component system CheB/CheR fusion protein